MKVIAVSGSFVVLAIIGAAIAFYVYLPSRLEVRSPERRACMVSGYALVATGLLACYQGPLPLNLDIMTQDALSIARSARDLMVAASLILWGMSVRRNLQARRRRSRRGS